jgi:hypothetical protein
VSVVPVIAIICHAYNTIDLYFFFNNSRYTFDSWKGSTIPVFTEGNRYAADVFIMKQGTTTAPQKLSQVTTHRLQFCFLH